MYIAFMVRNGMLFGMVLFSMALSVQSQNMVVNPGFEEIWECPFTMNQLKFTKSWFPFGTADPSPDYFHACCKNDLMSIPKNVFGEQNAHGGEAYIGLISYLTSKSGRGWRVPENHREFAMVQLTKPLIAGNQYYAEMWVNLADNCEFAINHLGMYFTRDMPNFDWQVMNFMHYKPQIVSPSDQIIEDYEGWTKISGIFTAKGEELALTIGTFYPDSSLVTKKTKRQFSKVRDKRTPKHLQPQIAYYFIDDVLVRPVDPTESIFPDPKIAKSSPEDDYFGPAEVGKKFTLQNIYFEFDKANLLRSSYLELNKLLSYLEKHRRIKIEIEGHTDNVGSAEYNMKLSKARAKAVVDYLVAKGLNEFRLEYKGYGSSRPIVPNSNPQNQALNRRVEFIILEN
ncbi:MAG: OmpA family protein [Reichenbachiella sp.]|uniref:OmpA family protein n=1 Tax=Reichenbachiella sp. TaxID=2184521 RepID=UPI0032648183